MLMGTFPAASKPFPPLLPSITPSSLPLSVSFLPTFTCCCPRALNPSAVVLQRYLSPLSLFTSPLFPSSLALSLFSLSSLMNGVAGL